MQRAGFLNRIVHVSCARRTKEETASAVFIIQLLLIYLFSYLFIFPPRADLLITAHTAHNCTALHGTALHASRTVPTTGGTKQQHCICCCCCCCSRIVVFQQTAKNRQEPSARKANQPKAQKSVLRCVEFPPLTWPKATLAPPCRVHRRLLLLAWM